MLLREVRSLLILIIFGFILIQSPCFSEDNQNQFKQVFDQANTYYNSGQYSQAARMYEELLKKGIQNGDLYYNLGNSYFKNDQIGKAILNYKNALVLNPREEDYKANLKFASEQTADQLPGETTVEPAINVLAFWYYDFNLLELLFIAIIVNIIACILVFTGFYINSDGLKIAKYIIIIVWLIIIPSAAIKFVNNLKVTEGVVIMPEIEVKSGNDYTFKTIFKLHEGTEFEIGDQQGNWYKIILQDGRKGWVNADSIGLVTAKM